MVDLTDEQRNVLNHVCREGADAFAENASLKLGDRYQSALDEHMVLFKQKYLDAKKLEGDNYKTAKEKKEADEERIDLEYENRGYAQKRRELYPHIGDQLDALWKGGADADEMKVLVNKVKTDISKE